MATETSIVREAPEIEAYKLGLLESAQKLADQPITLPTQQIAGMSQLQQDAIAAAAPATARARRCIIQRAVALGEQQTPSKTVAHDETQQGEGATGAGRAHGPMRVESRLVARTNADACHAQVPTAEWP